MSARYIVGDALSVMRTMPARSVDLILTSPPFLALRSYLPAEHPDKAREMGSEATPGAFIDTLLDLTEEARRVLAPHGSLCVELGDSYSGSGGAGGDYGDQGLRKGQPKFDGSGRRNRPADAAAGILAPTKRPGPAGRDSIPGWPLEKSLCLIPELYRIALAYGFNPLTGRETPRWRARNVVRHFRPNPPVGSLGDKVRPATSEWLVACTGPKRYFDLDSVRAGYSDNSHARTARGVDRRENTVKVSPDGNRDTLAIKNNDGAGAPPLDWWDDDDLEWRDAAGFVEPTFGYPGAHYATFSPKVIARLIEPMCPRRVCTVCGKPSERIVDIEHVPNRSTNGPQSIENRWVDGGSAGFNVRAERRAETLGWTDCGHGSVVCAACHVLVPYDYAIRQSRETSGGQPPLSDEAVLGESIQGPSRQAEVPSDLRGVRDRLSRANDDGASVQPELLNEVGPSGGPGTYASKWAGQSLLEGRPSSGVDVQAEGSEDEAGWRVHPNVGVAGHTGPTEERLHDGASVCDAEPHWPSLGALGVGAPSERSEGRQPDREPGDRDSRSSSGFGDLPSLPEVVRDSLAVDGYACSCGSRVFKYVSDHWRPGLVLDPFAGSGTTLAVASGHGRASIGIDLDARNADLARERVGFFLEVEHAERTPA